MECPVCNGDSMAINEWDDRCGFCNEDDVPLRKWLWYHIRFSILPQVHIDFRPRWIAVWWRGREWIFDRFETEEKFYCVHCGLAYDGIIDHNNCDIPF